MTARVVFIILVAIALLLWLGRYAQVRAYRRRLQEDPAAGVSDPIMRFLDMQLALMRNVGEGHVEPTAAQVESKIREIEGLKGGARKAVQQMADARINEAFEQIQAHYAAFLRHLRMGNLAMAREAWEATDAPALVLIDRVPDWRHNPQSPAV